MCHYLQCVTLIVCPYLSDGHSADDCSYLEVAETLVRRGSNPRETPEAAAQHDRANTETTSDSAQGGSAKGWEPPIVAIDTHSVR